MIGARRLTDLTELEPGIQEMSEIQPEFNPVDVWDRIGAGMYIPLVVERDGVPVGHALVQRLERPTSLYIVYLRGKGLLNRAAWAAAQKLAHDWGCVDDEGRPVIRFSSTRGWQRLADRMGFQKTTQNYRGALE